MPQHQHHRTVAVSAVLGPLLLLLLLPSIAVAQSTTPMVSATTAAPFGGFTSEQLGVLIGIPVALVVVIFIGVVIGCVVLHKVRQEEKLLSGKPYRSGGADGDGDTSFRPQQYYSDYLNSQTKIH